MVQVSRNCRAVLLGLTMAVSAVTCHAAETTVGRWCDRLLPNMPDMDSEITISITAAGQPEVVSRFGDGSSLRQPLVEQGGSTYLVKDSASGDRFRIIASTGELQILDKDGLISVARRLENKPRVGDCVSRR